MMNASGGPVNALAQRSGPWFAAPAFRRGTRGQNQGITTPVATRLRDYIQRDADLHKVDEAIAAVIHEAYWSGSQWRGAKLVLAANITATTKARGSTPALSDADGDG
jgi:hypothetical protein